MFILVPTVPQTGFITRISSTTLNITWSPPICDNGLRIGYTVSSHHNIFIILL